MVILLIALCQRIRTVYSVNTLFTKSCMKCFDTIIYWPPMVQKLPWFGPARFQGSWIREMQPMLSFQDGYYHGLLFKNTYMMSTQICLQILPTVI